MKANAFADNQGWRGEDISKNCKANYSVVIFLNYSNVTFRTCLHRSLIHLVVMLMEVDKPDFLM